MTTPATADLIEWLRNEAAIYASADTKVAKALSLAADRLEEAADVIEPLLTVCVRIDHTTREDVNATNRARAFLSSEQGGK